MNAGKRAAEIIDRLRSLYVKAPPRPESLDGNDTIREMVEMLRYEADRYKVPSIPNSPLNSPGSCQIGCRCSRCS